MTDRASRPRFVSGRVDATDGFRSVVGIGADFELEAVGGVAADDFEGDIGRAGNPNRRYVIRADRGLGAAHQQPVDRRNGNFLLGSVEPGGCRAAIDKRRRKT